MFRILLLTLVAGALPLAGAPGEPGPTLPAATAAPVPGLESTQRLLETMAQHFTHFATPDIVSNRWTERRWPADLQAEQQELLAGLRALGGERAALAELLQHPDPKVRTLALGALFVREDAHDLPLIAPLVRDSDTTFPLLHESLNSMGGPLPLVQFESPQTVGDVAQAMILPYLDAAYISVPGHYPGSAPFNQASARPADVLAAFEQYWAERGKRDRTASWFLVKMKRATRQTLPFRFPEDTDRVLAKINALPPAERGWTLLYVCEGVFHDNEDNLLPDSTLVAALKAVGPEALMPFLQHQPGLEDPDLRFADAYADRRNHQFLPLAAFILHHARDLLRPGDADAVAAGANGELPRREGGDSAGMWFIAAAELRSLLDPVQAADSVRAAIGAIPLRGFQGQREQAALAFALWQIRGAAEKDWLANWFYAALPQAQANVVHGPVEFLRAVAKEARPDTPALLSAIVGDARFAAPTGPPSWKS